MPTRTFVTQQQAAERFGVHVRTIRNWISKGLIVGYKMPTGRAIRVDLDEIERVMRVVPTTVARPHTRPFGPRAKIVRVAEAVVVPTVSPSEPTAHTPQRADRIGPAK